MDSSNEFNVLSLCAGYGGIELGLERLGLRLRTVAYVEREGFATANLAAKIEEGKLAKAPIHTDVKTFPYKSFRGLVDIMLAGYPCQPFSSAGKRKGTEDPRHLWPHIADGIIACRPTAVFFENVQGHVTLGLRDVLCELGQMGYRTTWGLFSAAEVGAPHQRKRVYILGWLPNTSGQRLMDAVQRCQLQTGMGSWEPAGCSCCELADAKSKRRPRCKQHKSRAVKCTTTGKGSGKQLADTNCVRSREDSEQGELRAGSTKQSSCDCRCSKSSEDGKGSIWPARPKEKQHDWEEPRTVANTKGRGNG